MRSVLAKPEPGRLQIARVLLHRIQSGSPELCITASSSQGGTCRTIPPPHTRCAIASTLPALSSQATKYLRASTDPNYQVKAICSNKKQAFFPLFFLKKKEAILFPKITLCTHYSQHLLSKDF